jgi:hypothetical protein
MNKLQHKFPFIRRVLATRGKKNKYNNGSARDVVVKCPCCEKERVTTDWAIKLRQRVGKSPAGWCRTCAMTLSHHPRWTKILPLLWKKHGNWTNLIIRRYSSISRRAENRDVKFNLSVLDLSEIPAKCPIFSWVRFEVPSEKASHYRGHKNLAPSLDRINSDKGYTKGNVRWVCSRANALRSNATYQELKALLLDSAQLSEKNK